MRTILFAVALATATLPAAAALAAKPAVYTPILSKTAIEGYDTVAYFNENKPVAGKDEFTTVYQGVTWKFANAANLAKFKANPAAFAPQYGGYCAWAVAHGYTASGDPKQWRIVNGKLYLNYNADIQSKWVKDIPGYIKSGDSNWPTVLNK